MNTKNAKSLTMTLFGDFNDNKKVFNKLIDTCHSSKLSVINSIMHPFYPVGMSVVVLIGESHLAIHTFPENNQALISVVTCGEDMTLGRIVDNFCSRINATKKDVVNYYGINSKS